MSAPPGTGPGRAGALAAAAAPLLVAAVAAALARSTLLPGLGFWDTGEFQAVPPLFGTAHPTGYPTFVTLGWLWSLATAPLGEPAFRMNLLSAALLGAAAGLVVVLVRGLGARTSLAVAAGLLVALTPIAWRIGTVADPHALHLALLVGLLVLLAGWERRRRGADPGGGAQAAAGASGADRWLAAAAGLYGVMLGNHTLTVLLAPGIALYVVAVDPGLVRRPRLVLGCAALLAGAAAALYLQLPLRAATGAALVYGRPDTWDGFWYVVLAEQFRGDLVNPFGDLARKAGDLAAFAVDQLGPIAALVPAAFVVVAVRRPRLTLLTASWLLVTAWFAASYTNAAIDRYYLGPLVVVATWLALAADVVADALAARLAGNGGRVEGWVATVAAATLAVALVLPAAGAAPRTAARVDASRDTRAAEWSRWVLSTVGRDAVVVSWWSFSTPLWYRTLVLGERPDVRVVDDRDRLDEGLGEVEDVIRAARAAQPPRPVYLVRLPAEIERLAATWALEIVVDPTGTQPLFRVAGPRAGG